MDTTEKHRWLTLMIAELRRIANNCEVDLNAKDTGMGKLALSDVQHNLKVYTLNWIRELDGA